MLKIRLFLPLLLVLIIGTATSAFANTSPPEALTVDSAAVLNQLQVNGTASYAAGMENSLYIFAASNNGASPGHLLNLTLANVNANSMPDMNLANGASPGFNIITMATNTAPHDIAQNVAANLQTLSRHQVEATSSATVTFGNIQG